jgi:hypothetical protein
MMEVIQQGHAGAPARVGYVRHQGDAHHARFLGPRTSSQMRIVAHLWEEGVLTRAEVDQIAGIAVRSAPSAQQAAGRAQG